MDARATLIWSLRDEVSAAAAKVQRAMKGIEDQAKTAGIHTTGFQNSLSGLVNPLTATIAVGAGLVAFLGDASRKAAEDEVANNKLGASLKANIPHWQGGTQAVENQIVANEKLGFTHKELQTSLALILPATKNVAEAQKVQTAAMDLARLKGISLEEATSALTKVEGGRYRALAGLIGSTKDLHNSTEALNAVMAIAQGQAVAYMDTVAGKAEELQQRVDRAQEKVGASLLPLESSFADFVSSGIDGWGMLGDAITHATGGLTDYDKAQKASTDQMLTDEVAFSTTRGNLSGIVTDIGTMTGALGDQADAVANYISRLKGQWASAHDLMTQLNDVPTPDNIVPNTARKGHHRWTKKNPRGSHNTQQIRGGPGRNAAGGWVGLDGPELSWVGENGPEYIQSAGGGQRGLAPGGGGATTINLVVDGRVLASVVDKHLYYVLNRAAPTLGRV